MENTKELFNPEKEVHDAYEKFIRYTYAILHFNNIVWTTFFISGVATVFLVLFVGIQVFNNPYSLFFLFYPVFLVFISDAHDRIKESNPTAEELATIQLYKEDNARMLKKHIERNKVVINLLIEEGIITQEQIDNLKEIWFRGTGMIFTLKDNKDIEVDIYTIVRLLANTLLKSNNKAL